NVPRIAFINKMDINGANFKNVVKMMRERLKSNAMAIQLPIGKEETFRGLVDVITKKAYYYNDPTGSVIDEGEIPADMVDDVNKAHDELVEFLAGTDDTLMEEFFSTGDLTVEEIKSALRKAVIKLQINPVLCGSAYKNKGVQKLLDAITDYLPSPVDVDHVVGFDVDDKTEKIVRKTDDSEPFCGLAFKIVSDPFVGRLAYVRVYSGTLQSGTYIYNSSRDKRERVTKIFQMHAAQREEIPETYSGEIVAVVGLKDTTTGDTLCDEKKPILLDNMVFPEPV
ncbi:MAG: EF-Tu/IF-2/RF-3 family GTPase, partial [Clostridia bacterium]